MLRTLTIIALTGALALGATACSKKQTPDSQGSLLSGTATSSEDDDDVRKDGIEDDDVTQRRQGPDMPDGRLPR